MTIDNLIFYVLYILLIFYIFHFTLKKQSPSAAKLQEPVFKFVSFMLLYCVAELDLILAMLLLVILVIDSH